ncbi:MAG: transposase, partial [Bryobacteraceae bacterium]|nr:transposase [Bryobacteraceae bacterium]
MPKSRPPYPPEFREEAVRLARTSGRPIAQIARELGVAWGTLSAWVKQAELDAGLRSDGLTTAEREELRRLRREVRILREEREILKKSGRLLRSGDQVQAVEAFGQVGTGEGQPRGSPDVPGAGRLPQLVLRVAASQAKP